MRLLARHNFGVAVTMLLVAAAMVSAGALVAGSINNKQSHVVSLLRENAAGECFRVNYFRYQVDTQRYATWQLEGQEIRAAQQGLRSTPRAVRVLHLNRRDRTTKLLLHAGKVQQEATLHNLKLARKSQLALPLTDCAQALKRPVTYKPPSARPWSSMSRTQRNSLLRAPPKPIR